MSYRVVKIIKGKGYYYDQRTWRDETGKVRTESRYVGPVDGTGSGGKLKRLTRPQAADYAADIEKAMMMVARLTGRSVEQQEAEMEAEDAARDGVQQTITVASTFAAPTEVTPTAATASPSTTDAGVTGDVASSQSAGDGSDDNTTSVGESGADAQGGSGEAI